ncbi:MAG: nucleoside transporter C-terminal domain-containing protein [Bacteroidota bacterium]
MDYLRALLGMAVLLGIATLFSRSRRSINWRLVAFGVGLQILFGFLFTNVTAIKEGFKVFSDGFVLFLSFTNIGSGFIFGDTLVNDPSFGAIVAFRVLPTIIFVSMVSSALYYLGILQKIVYGFAYVLAKTMGLSGAESLSAAGNVLLGQTEAPILVKPFVSKMTQSEIMCLMTGGMATIAGSVLGAYISFLGGSDPALQGEFAAHLLTASLMNAPAGIVFAKIIVPETNEKEINRELTVNQESIGVNLIDALSQGAGEGLRLALNVGAMLLAFVALIAMIDHVLGWFGDLISINELIRSSTNNQFDGFSLKYILGQVFRPIAFAIGVDWNETLIVGSLLGEKTVVNEFVAYANLANVKSALSEKSLLITTYALCGFSNFSSIAIQIGGIGVMAPNQQANLSRLGLPALLAATLACLMTATLAGALQ